MPGEDIRPANWPIQVLEAAFLDCTPVSDPIFSDLTNLAIADLAAEIIWQAGQVEVAPGVASSLFAALTEMIPATDPGILDLSPTMIPLLIQDFEATLGTASPAQDSDPVALADLQAKFTQLGVDHW